MQDRKEYIIEKAFEVFMAKGYDSVSMTVLQQKLKMSRGAMYRYFESKDDLFRAVIDKYFFRAIDLLIPDFDDNITVSEKIELTDQHLRSIYKYFDKLESIEIKFLNYTALVIQAAKKVPNFLDRMKDYREKDVKSWERAIVNSIKAGEVKPDLDIKLTSQIFSKAFNLADSSDQPRKSFLGGAETNRKTMDYLYSLIKI